MRGELEHVLHPDYTPPNSGLSANEVASHEAPSFEVPDHGVPTTESPTTEPARETRPRGSAAGDVLDQRYTASDFSADYPTEDVTDDGFAGPRSFS